MKKTVLFLLVAVFAFSASAMAESKLGVNVYPGAKLDAEGTKIVKQLATDGACYQTPDGLAKVIDFYKKQPGLKPLTPPKGEESPATVFQKGQNIQITIQPLPANPKEIHICIAKEE